MNEGIKKFLERRNRLVRLGRKPSEAERAALTEVAPEPVTKYALSTRSESRRKIIAVLPGRSAEIAKATGLTQDNVKKTLQHLVAEGSVIRLMRGYYISK